MKYGASWITYNRFLLTQNPLPDQRQRAQVSLAAQSLVLSLLVLRWVLSSLNSDPLGWQGCWHWVSAEISAMVKTSLLHLCWLYGPSADCCGMPAAKAGPHAGRAAQMPASPGSHQLVCA